MSIIGGKLSLGWAIKEMLNDYAINILFQRQKFHDNKACWLKSVVNSDIL